ncbi:MAG TPA: methyltransferase domain-containing protein [Candidatus Dormibacteraeota bacterium]
MSAHESADSSSDWDAATYDRVADPQTRWGIAVLDRLPLEGDETVIDAGCGTGRVTQHLLRGLPRGRVVALDASAAMLEEARRRLAGDDRVRFVHANLLSFTDRDIGDAAPVDAVFSTATFHWVLDHGRLFANLAAVLRPGGRLVAQCGARGNIDGLTAVVRSLGVERPGTWFYASADDTVIRLEEAGFVDIDVWINKEPTPFDTTQELRDFLEAVCVREAVATMDDREREGFLNALVARMPERVIDYVRLNIVAVRGP